MHANLARSTVTDWLEGRALDTGLCGPPSDTARGGREGGIGPCGCRVGRVPTGGRRGAADKVSALLTGLRHILTVRGPIAPTGGQDLGAHNTGGGCVRVVAAPSATLLGRHGILSQDDNSRRQGPSIGCHAILCRGSRYDAGIMRACCGLGPTPRTRVPDGLWLELSLVAALMLVSVVGALGRSPKDLP